MPVLHGAAGAALVPPRALVREGEGEEEREGEERPIRATCAHTWPAHAGEAREAQHLRQTEIWPCVSMRANVGGPAPRPRRARRPALADLAADRRRRPWMIRSPPSVTPLGADGAAAPVRDTPQIFPIRFFFPIRPRSS